MFPCARHVILYLVLVQPRIRPDIAENFLTGIGGSRGGGDRGSRPSRKITKIGFLSNTVMDPLKNRQATRSEFIVRPSSGRQQTPFKWRFAGGPMMARF